MDRKELVHQWAHQVRPRRKAGNLSYDGPTLYSYSTAIAHIHGPNKRGERFVLMTDRRYSVTTAAHKSAARSAVSHLPLLEVPHFRPRSRTEHAENYAYVLRRMDDAVSKAQRAMSVWRANDCRRVHAELRELLGQYDAFFGLRRKAPGMKELEFNAAASRAWRIENPDPESADKRERAKATRKAAAAIRERKALELAAVHDMARRSDWRLYGAFGAGGVGRYQPVMLRLDGEEIVTSMGARIPAAAAPMVWSLVQLARRTADYDVSRGARRIRIGDYPLDRIDADGTLHAGCHTIPYSELAMMARALGLEGGAS
jgi:hypothetical protein